MFIGREKELQELSEEFNSQKKSIILVYGKRRIGKSSLIQEASKSFNGLIINHLFVKTSYESNLKLLTRSISIALKLPSSISFNSIFDLFDFIKAQNKEMLLIFDEYQYFKESLKASEIDSYMQMIVDSLPSNIKIVFCGSYISIMKELLQEENPLFGRFTRIIHLREFDYYEASLFYPDLSEYNKIKFYSIFGGSPFVLINLDYQKSLEENIIKLLINQDSLLRSYIENIMLREIQKNYDIRILEIISNGKKHYGEIQNLLSFNDSGLLDKQLKNLLTMETITKVFPINKPNDKKKLFYEIKDNLMRFYFAFIFANESLIMKLGEEEFFKNYILNGLKTYISYRFEDIALQYFMRLAKKGKVNSIQDLGSYWYDDKKNKTNGQFDCVLKEKDGYAFYEVKFYEKPMNLSECKKEEKQIRSLTELECKKIGFISSAGFNFYTDEYDLIDSKKLYLI